MFKKTLIAVALAGLSANALAVNVASTPLQHSVEAAKSAASFTVADATATATMKAEYKVDDLITLTYSQNFADGFTALPNLLVTNTDAGATTITLGKLSQTANSIVYRVTDISVTAPKVATTVGAVIKLPKVEFNAAAVRAAKLVTVKYSATLSNGTTPLDQASGAFKDTADLLKLTQQFTTSASTKLDGVVDVTLDRKEFVRAAGFPLVPVVTDVVALNLNDAAPFTGVTVAANSVVYTVKGDFAFLDTDAATAGIQLGANTVTATDGAGAAIAAGKIAIEADKIVVTNDGVAQQEGATTITITNNARGVMSAQTFTADAAVSYTDAGANLDGIKGVAQTDTTSAMAAGAWTLNGASVDVPYMPYGAGVEQFLWVTNKGNQAGDIKVTAFDQAGKAYGPFNLGSSAKGLKKLDAALKTELVKAGLDEAKNPRVALNVTVNAPATDITVYAAYKAVAADDRLTVPTKSLN